MEIFGLHEYIKDVTRRLAKLGALAVAPDYYFRKGEEYTEAARFFPPVAVSRRPGQAADASRRG
jgi:carboxymethylenebutenolidase